MTRRSDRLHKACRVHTGKTATLQSDARLQERSLALDDAQTMRALFKKEKELEAILDSEDESEPVKAEALRELEAIAEFQREHASRTKDSAQRAARGVRRAILRLHQGLHTALDTKGTPQLVLRSFAEHFEQIPPQPLHAPLRPEWELLQRPPRRLLYLRPPRGVIRAISN